MRVLVESQEIYKETTSKGTELSKQQVKMIGEGGPPVYFSVDAPQGKPYPHGEYTLSVRAFRSSRFGGLEVDPYRVQLLPAAAVRTRAVA